MRKLVFLAISIFLVGCASTPPRNKNNACLILMEKNEWRIPLREASERWNIPDYTILSIIYHESKFVSNAKPPRKSFLGMTVPWRRISSAYGYSQALEGTWEEYKTKTRIWGSQRSDFADSVDFIGWYLNRSVKKLNISAKDAYHLYLTYHQGTNGYRKKSYLRKPAIMRYARKVQETALIYKRQISSCHKMAENTLMFGPISRSKY
jgi:hypothetical protein